MHKFSFEKEQDIIARYRQGESQKDIAKVYNTFNTSIRRVLLRYNIIPRSTQKLLRYCKHNPFKRNDEYSDYFLGLLLTDGCITSTKKAHWHINLSLSEVDKYMVYFFRDWASPQQAVSKLFQKINNSYMYSCNIANSEVIEWLHRKGNFYNKSYNAKLYTKMNWNILRGLFDGDGGYASANKDGLNWYICGASKTLLDQVAFFLAKNNIKTFLYHEKSSTFKKNGLYYLKVYKYKDVLELGLKMYSNAHVFLNRKYMKWLTFYENKRDKYSLNSGNAGIANPERNLPTPNEVIYKVGRDVQRL